MKRFRTNYDRSNHTNEFEVNEMPSETVPNQALSIPELIKRYAQCLPLGGKRVGYYEDEHQQQILNGKDWRTLDLSEQYEILNAVHDEISTINRYSDKTTKNQQKREDNPPMTD